MTKRMVVTDGFGRRVAFTGEHLLSETTDTPDERKPQWLDIDVWRTERGAFVVRRSVEHRVSHRDRNCVKLRGYDIVTTTPEDDPLPCKTCSPDGTMASVLWGAEARITVDVYKTPEELIDGMQVEGQWTRLSRAVLAEIAKKDERVDVLWNNVEVP